MSDYLEIRTPTGKLSRELLHINRDRFVVPVSADVERQWVAFAERVRIDAAAQQLR